MFISTYLPVNMHRTNCAVYSSEKVFPEEKLLKAYSFVTGHAVEGVEWNDGNVVFPDDDTTLWTLPEIYLAYEAYNNAAINNFSFYMVKDNDNIPQLFISKSFKGHRILVNAFTMHSVIVGKVNLVAKVASMIDKTASSHYCVDLFNTIRDIEKGSAKFLKALIVNRDSEYEYMAVSPVLTTLFEVTTTYSVTALNDLRDLRDGNKTVTPTFKCEDNKYINLNNQSWPTMSSDHVNYIIDTYDATKEKRSNYVELCNEDYVTELYFSTNYRYLVDAKTFECVVIKNQHTRDLLISLSKRVNNTSDELQLAWMLAKTE